MTKYNTFLDTSERVDCCGCESCKQICPQKCITMEYFDDGFRYPVINQETCIQCNLCRKVCPISESKKIKKTKQNQKCFYGWHRDNSIRHDSTSGGAFSAIAELVLENNGLVYGAIYNEIFKVCHQGINKKSELWKLRQSKYIQSEIGNCYIEIKEKLAQKKTILFCGTPCQIHGLSEFLKKKNENLILVDIICHGVTSPLLFKTYIESLEKRKKSKIKKIRFRDKIHIGNFSSLSYTTIEFQNNKRISSDINSYLRAYMNGLMQRESCEACPYSTLYRWSDITIGDFWGIVDIIPSIKEEFFKGISLIITNTQNGKNICNKLFEKMHLYEINISSALNGKNQQLMKPVRRNKNKNQLYIDIQRMPIELALIKGIGFKNYLKTIFMIFKNQIKMKIPKKIYKLIHQLYF